MSVLSRQILRSHGPYIEFIDHHIYYNIEKMGLPERRLYEDDIFFQLSESLSEIYCDVTRSYLFFDAHGFIQIHYPHEIRVLSAKFMDWAKQIAVTRSTDLDNVLQSFNIYDGAAIPDNPKVLTGEDLRLDLIETALFLAQRLAVIARSHRVLLIDGI